jgi:hypothetical protein
MWSLVDIFALNIHWKPFEMNVTSKVVWQWQTEKFWAAEKLCALFVVVDEKVELFSKGQLQWQRVVETFFEKVKLDLDLE